MEEEGNEKEVKKERGEGKKGGRRERKPRGMRRGMNGLEENKWRAEEEENEGGGKKRGEKRMGSKEFIITQSAAREEKGRTLGDVGCNVTVAVNLGGKHLCIIIPCDLYSHHGPAGG